MNNLHKLSTGQIIGLLIAAIVLLLAIIAFNGFLVMLLWNALVPTLFNGAAMTSIWQGIGLLILASLIGSAFRGYAYQRPNK